MDTTVFVFDDRESTLQGAFEVRTKERPDVRIERRRLEMGDVVIGTEQAPVAVIVERKEVTDLMNSLFDGRLAEQCDRMSRWQSEPGNHEVWVVLIIEGVATATTFHALDPDVRFRHDRVPARVGRAAFRGFR